ncbi:hypothetical protein PTTG_08859 [Puccinia triticina 1-1 BBBD Race 1]|uniref:Uncharacterized protein n=1 Tax=Puccinia triticina (isolate 1-1 / race 1 (BBBD)) TaxID=630390 RepID=A0A180GXZ0_PUCT1|nr:hypothetical protein PTTG_08859 [Puccinia triticina 1-1 BBBD Race 1]
MLLLRTTLLCAKAGSGEADDRWASLVWLFAPAHQVLPGLLPWLNTWPHSGLLWHWHCQYLAEYGYIPRLVRKTNSTRSSPSSTIPNAPPNRPTTCLLALTTLVACRLTSKYLVCPNTATDSQEGQYLMGLNPSGYESGRSLDTLEPLPANTSLSGSCPAQAPQARPPVAAASRCASTPPTPAPRYRKKLQQQSRYSATGNDEGPSKISFSGDRSNHPSPIGKTRKRSKQLTYAADNQDGAGAHGPVGPRPSATDSILLKH